jgi:methyl-accepting chemotaxis protein
MFLLAFLFGCANQSFYQQIDLEIAQLKNDSERLQNDMALFKKAYNPELQEVFSENILEAEKHRKSIEKIQNDIENMSNNIHVLLSESEYDRMLISENLETSTAENIVNEFRQLNIEWDNTVFELSNLVAASERAAVSSHQAAIQAAEKAGAAEQSADYASQSMNMIEEQRRSLSRIRDKIRNAEAEIRKLRKRLNEIDESEGRHKRGKEAQEKQ